MWIWIGTAAVAALVVVNLALLVRLALRRSGGRVDDELLPLVGRPSRPREVRPREVGPARSSSPAPIPGATVEPDGSVHELGGRRPVELPDHDSTQVNDVVLVSASARSDKGLRRLANEDGVLTGTSNLYAVADGMGGHASGDLASRTALAAVAQAFEEGGLPDHHPAVEHVPGRASQLVRVVWHANEAVRAQARRDGVSMGTTLVVARFATRKRTAYVANVGDSRCYRVRDGVATQITRDHTVPLRAGQRRAELSRAMGMLDEVAVDVHVVDTKPGDHFVLCSDGLWTHVHDVKLAALVGSSRDLEEVVRRLVAEAVHQGTRDDVSVILVRVLDPLD